MSTWLQKPRFKALSFILHLSKAHIWHERRATYAALGGPHQRHCANVLRAVIAADGLGSATPTLSNRILLHSAN
jgi:hypothetical protein